MLLVRSVHFILDDLNQSVKSDFFSYLLFQSNWFLPIILKEHLAWAQVSVTLNQNVTERPCDPGCRHKQMMQQWALKNPINPPGVGHMFIFDEQVGWTLICSWDMEKQFNLTAWWKSLTASADTASDDYHSYQWESKPFLNIDDKTSQVQIEINRVNFSCTTCHMWVLWSTCASLL